MNMNTISYWFQDAFHTMRKDLKNQLISLGTMLATMVLIAIACIIFQNANTYIETEKDTYSKINVYLNVGISDEEAKTRIEPQLLGISGVSNVEYRSREEAHALALKEPFKEYIDGYSEEIIDQTFPTCFFLTFEEISDIQIIFSELNKIDGIADYNLDNAVAEAVRSAKIYKTIALTGIILIIEFSVFMMMNITKLMVYAKRREISIMKYVGAKDLFIKMPFAIQGLITAFVAVFITMFLLQMVYPFITQSTASFGQGFSYVSYEEIWQSLLILLLIIGCAIGGIGSTASMNRYLDV